MNGSVPITMGSPRSRTVSTDTARITDAWFPPGAVLHTHTHQRHLFGVMISGSFLTKIGTRALPCVASSSWTEPAGEPHRNEIEGGGARVMVLELEVHHRLLCDRSYRAMLDNVSLRRDLAIATDARRVLGEMRHHDELSAAVLDSLVLLMLSRACRADVHESDSSVAPAWVTRARDYLHDNFRTSVQLDGVAQAVGVDALTLSRYFRRAFGCSPAEYARARRIDWSLEQIASTSLPISAIAHRAGFADQSHLTRACTARVGLPPAAYRRAVTG